MPKWMVDFPEKAQHSFLFLDPREATIMATRIERDRADLIPAPFTWAEIFRQFLDPKLYGFSALLFILVSTVQVTLPSTFNSLLLVEPCLDGSVLFFANHVSQKRPSFQSILIRT